MALTALNLRAVCFDVYGTLLEVGPPPADGDARWHELFLDLLHSPPRLSRLDFSVAASKAIARRHEIARTRGIPWPEIHWPSVIMEVVPEFTRLNGEDQAEFLFRQIQTGHTTRMMPETAAVLRWFSEHHILLGIASNAQAYTLRELQDALQTQGLNLGLFTPDLCFWSFEHGFSKPDPHVFQILTARLTARGIHTTEALMVGDRFDNDIAPARNHGWQTWQLGRLADGDWAGLCARWLEAPPPA